MTGKILVARLRNAIRRYSQNPDLIIQLRNIRRNGEAFGCSGFVTNPAVGSCVYITTDTGSCNSPIMYRYCKDNTDTIGFRNHFCDTLDDLVEDVCYMLGFLPDKREQKGA